MNQPLQENGTAISTFKYFRSVFDLASQRPDELKQGQKHSLASGSDGCEPRFIPHSLDVSLTDELLVELISWLEEEFQLLGLVLTHD